MANRRPEKEALLSPSLNWSNINSNLDIKTEDMKWSFALAKTHFS